MGNKKDIDFRMRPDVSRFGIGSVSKDGTLFRMNVLVSGNGRFLMSRLLSRQAA